MAKRNKGQKSIKVSQKGSKNPSHWRDSKGNHKFLCLHCLKSMKGTTTCCGFKMFHLGSRPRTPKITAPKQEWRKFFDLFVTGGRCESKGQLHQIIKLRKSYGLSTTNAEEHLRNLINEIDNDIISVFDIKRHEAIEAHNPYDSEMMEQVTASATRYNSLPIEKIERSKEYFVVPFFATHNYRFYIPTKIENFDIQKCRAQLVPKHYGTQKVMGLSVLTENKKEVISLDYQPDSQYGYRQELYIFESRVKAMAFRQEFLTIVFGLLKEKELPYLSELVGTVNLDYQRVSKKSPELLI